MTSALLDPIFPLAEPVVSAPALAPGLSSCALVGQPAVAATASTQAASADANEQELDDEGLLLAICQGAEWAVERLYQRYYQHAYSLASRLVRESGLAEDIVQEAFFSLWRKASFYQPQQGSVRTWLLAIVRHRAIDTVRAAASRKMQCRSLPTENEQDLSTEQPEVWEQVWWQERARILRTALAQLPPEQRQVIELAYFAGYTHVEIAQRWNIPLGTVKGRIRLGLRKMEHLLCQRGVQTAR